MTTADIFTPEAYELIKRLEFKSMFSRFEQKTTQTEAVETAFAHIITGAEAVSYTHLDVYKRQLLNTAMPYGEEARSLREEMEEQYRCV